MMSSSRSEIESLTRELTGTVGGGAATLVPEVYEELRSLSEAYMRAERSDHTLSATALVNEAFARLASGSPGRFESREHFFRIAARTMRRILINYARDRRAIKRGGDEQPIVLQETLAIAGQERADVLEVDEALERLARIDPVKAQLVELRFFGGATVEQASSILGISVRSAERDWRFARAWLRAELGQG